MPLGSLGTEVMRSFLLFAVVALVVAGVLPRLYLDASPGGTATAGAPTTTPTPSDGPRSVTVPRGDNGHFNIQAVIDGRRMEFLIDTGASAIALRERDAARLGIHPTPRDYSATAHTANGTVRVAPIELNRVEVGGLVVRNVRAVVIPDEALGQNLLGMTFLSRVRWQQANGRLVLEQ